MVEVFDFQKNFKTGKEIRKSKFKDNAMTKGVATIELFDKNNNLVEKTVSNNFIKLPIDTDYLYSHLSKVLEGREFRYTTPLQARQFGQIHLRNGEFDEDPSTIFMRGNSIGWAERTNTDGGTDTTKGAYNSNESFTEYTQDGYYHAHLVYDFATSKANGTINHVYWSPYLYSNSKRAMGCLTPFRMKGTTTSNYLFLSSSTGVPIFDACGQLWSKMGDLYYKVINKDRYLQAYEDIKLDTESGTSSITPQSRRINKDYHITRNYEYKQGNVTGRYLNFELRLTSSKTNEYIKTKNFDGINDFAGIKKYSEKATSSGAYVGFHEIPFCTESGNVAVVLYFYASSSILPTFNDDGTQKGTTSSTYYMGIYNIYDEVWVLEPNPDSYISANLGNMFRRKFLSMKCDENKHFLFSHEDSGTIYYLFDETTLAVDSFNIETLVSSDCHSTNYANYYNFKGGIDYNGLFILSQESSSYLHINRFIPYNSHTKLPSPVTKTNTTTMKVTYDYYIQVPNMFAEKGKEFDWGQE